MICPLTFQKSFIITLKNKQTNVIIMLRIFKRVNWKSMNMDGNFEFFWSYFFKKELPVGFFGLSVRFIRRILLPRVSNDILGFVLKNCTKMQIFQKQVLMTNESYPSIITERNGMKEITFPKVLICSHSMHSKKRLRKYYPQITGKLLWLERVQITVDSLVNVYQKIFQMSCYENFMARQSQKELANFGTSLWYRM